MAVFPVVNDAVQLTSIGQDEFTDAAQNGVLFQPQTGYVYGAESFSPGIYCQGVFVKDYGDIKYVDATAGLPPDTTWSNGLPRSGENLCIATSGAVANYSNGIPFVANGAVKAAVNL